MRHGPDTTLEQQRIRAAHHITPDGVVDRRPNAGSRFFRWQDLADAIVQAEEARRLGNTDNVINIEFDHIVGEGYLPGGTDYRQTHIVTVRLNDEGTAFTAYPNIKVME